MHFLKTSCAAGAAALLGAVIACSAPGSSKPPGAGATGDDGGSTPMIPSGPASLPFTLSDQFIPSGFMGDSTADFSNVVMSRDPATCIARATGALGFCYTVNWTPVPLMGQTTAWVGVYWQYPENNWGALPGKVVAAGAKKVTFKAAGAKGGEDVVFIAGGVDGTATNPTLTNKDNFKEQTEVTLTTAWQDYSIDVSTDTYNQVIGAFAWTVTTSSTSPITFYIDNIVWE